MIRKYFLIPLFLILAGACKNNSSHSSLTNINEAEESDTDGPVNVIDQALPSLVIIPSDQMLRKFKFIHSERLDGVEYLNRDYQGYLLNNDNNKKIIRAVQNYFADMDFPINDLEVSLKNLQNNEIKNEADGVEMDAKTLLLYTVSPNYLIDLDYTFDFSRSLKDHSKELIINLSLVDPVTEKVLGSSQISSSGNTIDEALESLNKKDFNKLAEDLKREFTHTIKYGREITVRIAVGKNSGISLSDLLSNGDTYSDYITDYMDTHTKKGTYSMLRNTDTELSFTNVRITNLTGDGRQANAYRWAREMCKSLRKNLGVNATNKSQKLNEVVIEID